MDLFDHDFRKYTTQFILVILFGLAAILFIGGLNPDTAKEADNFAKSNGGLVGGGLGE
ncbi:MAG: hypothetical protein WC797_02170 [Candidatus Paceibacterota bacterium]|jgi:hypothetical protein